MRSRWWLSCCLIAGLIVTSMVVWATPEAATWRRQTLVGQNGGHFFRYVTVSDHPGTYYGYSRSLRLEKVRKSDMAIVESIPLLEVTYSKHPDSLRWSETSDSVPVFDLPGYLRTNKVALPFAEDLIHYRTFAIDSAGVWEVFDDGRIQLATRKELERQIPNLGDEPRVVGIEETSPDSGVDYYLRIESGASAWDTDWAEDLVMIRGVELH